MADDYSPVSTASSASVRYIELSAPPEAEQEAFVPTVYGFQLMDADIWSVDASLTASVPSMMHDRGELDPKDVYRASILYEQSGVFTYFFFGDGGLLSGVGQSTFSMDGAD